MHFDTQTLRIVHPARQTDAVALKSINVYVSYDGNLDECLTRVNNNDLLAVLECKCKPSTDSQQNDGAN